MIIRNFTEYFQATKLKNYLDMPYKLRTIFAMILLIGLIVPASVQAQRVGLVLSGGGAKGLYHVGVIRALEENRIPIDYVSGTSMGSIVAGMYAAGYTPEEMTEICTSGQIEQWMTGRIDERYRHYYKEIDQTGSLVSVRLNLSREVRDSLAEVRRAQREMGVEQKDKRTLELPSALIASDQVEMALIGYFMSATVASGGNFDSLMVPFRCVAADMVERRGVVFKSGDLGEAIRASISIPLVFNPVEKDSMLLYDGGLFDNFPWRALEEEFAPDFFIGSKCTSGSTIPDATDLVDQAITLMMNPTDYELPEGRSLMIERPFTGDVSMFDFDRAEYIIECGYRDAMEQMPKLLEAIERREDSTALATRREAFRARCPELIFNEIEVSGLSPEQTQYINDQLGMSRNARGRSRRDTTAVEYTFDELRDRYFTVLSDGDVRGQYPKVSYNDSTSRFAVDLSLTAKSNNRVLFGGNISSTALNQAYIGFEHRRIGRTANRYSANVYLSPMHTFTNVGGHIEFLYRRPLFIDFSANFMMLNYYQNNNGSLANFRSTTYAKTNDHYASFSFGAPMSRKSVLKLTLNGGGDIFRYFQGEGYTSEDILDKTTFPFAALQLGFDRNDLNRLMYPNRGLSQQISAIAVGGSESYYAGTSGYELGLSDSSHHRYWFGARFTREQYFGLPSVPWFSFGYLIDATYTTHPNFTNRYASNMTAPAFTPTPHSRIVYLDEYRAHSFVGAGLIPIFEFSRNLYLRLSGYVFYPQHDRFFAESERLRYILDASLVYQTFIGPVSISLSKYDTSHENSNWFISFNLGFAMFSKRGLFY